MSQRQSTTVAATPEEDLAVVREMANEMQDYLLGEDVYRTLVVTTNQGEERVQSSCGDLLARLHRLDSENHRLTQAQRDELTAIKRRISAGTGPMRARYSGLIQREIRARVNSLKWYLDDCQEDTRACRVQYPFEIRNRQRVAELLKALDDETPNDIRAEVEAVDRRLREATAGAAFVWDKRVQDVYPKEEYWYLYALPTG